MGVLFDVIWDVFSSILTWLFPFTKDVTEEEIEKNIHFLKKYQWFQSYLKDDKFKSFIMKDKDVRFVIGKLNSEKMDQDQYHKKQRKKLQQILRKKSI
ncbi:hypothetical protein [Ectobacillus antri]|uniref:hypothetical protein n=1 Tax=Ectobacillus antri TaxID=2486280 RepID=UPI000F5AA616|nr:hypothetical protein [Ectobacillus antri]